MGVLDRLRVLAVVVAFLAGGGALLSPSLGLQQLSDPLMIVGFVALAFWLVLFIRSRIPT